MEDYIRQICKDNPIVFEAVRTGKAQFEGNLDEIKIFVDDGTQKGRMIFFEDRKNLVGPKATRAYNGPFYINRGILDKENY